MTVEATSVIVGSSRYLRCPSHRRTLLTMDAVGECRPTPLSEGDIDGERRKMMQYRMNPHELSRASVASKASASMTC